MGLFRKKDDTAEQLRGLHGQLQEMADRLDRSESEKLVLIEQIDRLADENKQLGSRIDDVSSLEETVEEQRARLADLALVAAALHGDESLRSQLGKVAERMSALDGRVDQISTELVNQLDELGGELDALGRAVEVNDVGQIRTKLDDITSGQERLANEQARYEIQFRQDLAEAAERFRRPGNR